MTDAEAMEFWLRTGCVTDEYMERVCGPACGSVTIGPARLILDERDLAHIPCPFGPEPDWGPSR